MSQLTPEQQAYQVLADSQGRELVTMIDGRVAIILRPSHEEETAERLDRIIRAIEASS